MDGKVKTPAIVGSDKFVDIGTHRLHVILTDASSDHTIVLEASGGKYSTAYQEILELLAPRTRSRVMSYDRSGFGQSELGPDDLDAIAEVDALFRNLRFLAAPSGC